MMRKLAVTVFAISFAALGCGSDSGTPNTVDTGTTTPGVDSGVKKDTSATPDVYVAVDTSSVPDVFVAPVDTAKLDVTVAPVDVAVSDDTNTQVDVGQTVDASVKTDVLAPAVDGPKPSIDTAVDSGETQKAVDSGAAVDSDKGVDGGVDGGSVG